VREEKILAPVQELDPEPRDHPQGGAQIIGTREFMDPVTHVYKKARRKAIGCINDVTNLDGSGNAGITHPSIHPSKSIPGTLVPGLVNLYCAVVRQRDHFTVP